MKRTFCLYLRINILFFFLVLSLSSVLAQDLKKYNFGIFSINLPNNCQLMQEENNDGMVCKTYNTPNKKFLYNCCVFTIDEDFDLKERLREEALGLNIDIEKVGYFAVTTGTDSPLLSTMVEFENYSLTMGIYPYYEKGKAVFVCLIDIENKNVVNLVEMMSTFRPLK